jgi:hypothetical protein
VTGPREPQGCHTTSGGDGRTSRGSLPLRAGVARLQGQALPAVQRSKVRHPVPGLRRRRQDDQPCAPVADESGAYDQFAPGDPRVASSKAGSRSASAAQRPVRERASGKLDPRGGAELSDAPALWGEAPHASSFGALAYAPANAAPTVVSGLKRRNGFRVKEDSSRLRRDR